MAVGGVNCLKFSISIGWILDKLNVFQILKSDGANFGRWRFAALRDTWKPFWYCLKYGGSLMKGEKAIHVGWRLMKVMGGWSILIWVWSEHLISNFVGSVTDPSQLPCSK